MPGGCQYELDYLRQLKAKYGSHYIKKYFSFSFAEIAQKIGIEKGFFYNVISGKVGLSEKYQEALKEIFKTMQIEEKTKDFKESASQLSIKEAYHNIKNTLTILLICGLITTMRVETLFLFPIKNFFPLYIGCQRRLISYLVNTTLSVAVTFIVTSTLIFFTKIAYFSNKLRIPNFGVRFCLEG